MGRGRVSAATSGLVAGAAAGRALDDRGDHRHPGLRARLPRRAVMVRLGWCVEPAGALIEDGIGPRPWRWVGRVADGAADRTSCRQLARLDRALARRTRGTRVCNRAGSDRARRELPGHVRSCRRPFGPERRPEPSARGLASIRVTGVEIQANLGFLPAGANVGGPAFLAHVRVRVGGRRRRGARQIRAATRSVAGRRRRPRSASPTRAAFADSVVVRRDPTTGVVEDPWDERHDGSPACRRRSTVPAESRW